MAYFRIIILSVFFISAPLFGVATEAGTLTVAWDPPVDATAAGYILWYGTSAGVYTYRFDVGAATVHTVDGLEPRTYYFAVQAYNASGSISPMSAEVSGAPAVFRTLPATNIARPPAISSPGSSGGASAPPRSTQAPSALSALLRDRRFIDLRWTAPTQNPPSSYRIEVGTAPSETDVSSFTTGATTTFTVSDLPPRTYYLRVREVSDAGVSDASNEVAITLPGSDAPRDLQSIVNGGSVHLQWQPPADAAGISGYLLEAGSAAGQSDLAVLPIDSTSFDSPVLSPGVYYVRVRPLATSGPGSASNEVIVSIGGLSAPPCTFSPGAMQTVTAGANGAIVSVSWQSGAGEPPTSYLLEVGSGAGRYDIAAIHFGADTTSFNAPAANGTYVLRVTALNSCGASAPSPERSVTIGGAAPVQPGAPQNPTHEVNGTAVSLTWSPPASGGETTRYVIEATDTTGNPLATLDTGSAATRFTHGAVGPGVYVVRVRAANAAGVGRATDPVTVIVNPP